MNHDPNHRPAEGDDLAWAAFRFIAGEMTAAETQSFEERLAIDQAARESVAEAVELFHAVCAAEAAEPVLTVAARQQSTWSQKVMWIASGAAAAALLLAVGLNLGSVSSWFTTNHEQAVATVSPALADAWSLVRSEYASEEVPEAEEGISHLVASTAEVDEDDLALATEAPSWMTAAVLGLSTRDTQPDGGESLPQEN
jgi:anti-sigma factor RsiW